MSIKIMTYIWEHSPHSGSDLLMLLAIADHANDQGLAWPSLPTLAKKCRVLKRQAIKIIQHLEAADSISIEHGGGRGHASIYRIKGVPWDTLCRKGVPENTVSEEKGVLQDTVSLERVSQETPFTEIKGVLQDTKGVLQDTPTIIEPTNQEKPKTLIHVPAKKVRAKGAPTYTPGFLLFWSIYPAARRASKPSCQKVWLVANLEPRIDEICEKVERLKITSWLGKEPHFVPMTSTWLNQGRYDDDLMPIPQATLTGGRVSPKTARNAEASSRIIEEIESGRNGQSPIFRGAHLHG